MNQANSLNKTALSQPGLLRALWLLLAAAVVGLLAAAAPLRYQMLTADVYGFGGGLQALGLSLTFFAAYFTGLELLVAAGSLGVAALIVWKRPDDWFAMLVASTLTLFGLMPPLLDGLIFAYPAWAVPVSALRLAVYGGAMAVVCLFPNGRFAPRWTAWLLALWLVVCGAAFANNPLLMADMAILPNTRTLADGLWLLAGAGWFAAAIAAQGARYRRTATTVEKQQMKWLLWGFALTVLVSVISILLVTGVPALQRLPDRRTLFTLVMGGLMLLAALTLPAAIAVAILRYRLWQVDLWLNRTLIYGGLTALVTLVYVLLVGVVGSLAVEQAAWAAAVVATALVVVGLRPLHRRLERGVDRLLPPPPRATPAGVAGKASRPALLRAVWAANVLLALVLFAAGLAAQAARGFWQAPPAPALASVPALAGGFMFNGLAGSSGLYPFVLVAGYVQAAAFVSVGLFLFWRKSGEVMVVLASWMLIAVGLGFTPTIVFLPLLQPAWHAPVSLFQASLFGSVFLFLCLFPNGRFFPAWSRYAAALWLGFTLLWLPFPQLNLHRATGTGAALIFAAVVFLGIGFQLVRYRRLSTADEKQQAKWVIAGFTAANFGLFVLVVLLALGLLQSAAALSAAMLLLGMAAIFIPLTTGVALLRYRLWDIDVIINRTLVYGGLSLAIAAAYIVLVGAFGALFQARGSFLFALLATGLIAVLFQPLRARLQRGVNRLMFGERDDPYAVLSRLGAQLQTTTTPEAMLQSVVETIAAALKLPYVAIELASPGTTAGGARLNGAAVGRAVAQTTELPLLYQGETVGYLVVSPRSPGESFTEREQQLLADLAAQAGAMAHSVRLTAALQRAREELVLTREEERRRIRRDLHDGLGPTLASQTFILDTILEFQETQPDEATRLLHALKSQNRETVAEIRRLVYELRPPALDELGLAGALQAHVAHLSGPRGLQIRLTATPDPLPPLSAAVEVAAYRIVLEAITNVVRHAVASRCDITLRLDRNGQTRLHVDVADDGRGLPPDHTPGVGLDSMRKRAEELGGSCRVARREDGGTRVAAILPVAVLPDAGAA